MPSSVLTASQRARLFDLTPALVRTLDGVVLFWNQAATALYGYDADAARQQPLHTLLGTRFPQPLAEIEEELRVVGEWQGRLVQQRADGALLLVASRWLYETGDTETGIVIEVNTDLSAIAEAEARHAAIVHTAIDAVITIDAAGRVLEFNPAAEQMFGYRRDEMLGQEMAAMLLPAQWRAAHRTGLARLDAGGPARILGRRLELTALRRDGREFPVELTIVRSSERGPARFTGQLRDLTDRQHSDRRRNARVAFTQELAQAGTLAEAAPVLLSVLCDQLDWDVGAIWLVTPTRDAIECVAVRAQSGRPVEAFVARTRDASFPIGVGLPGRVWQSGLPVWVPDVTRDHNFPRGPIAAAAGLHGALACPLAGTARAVVGAIEFFSREIRVPDPDLLEMMATIGVQLGQFIERERMAAAVRESEQRFARFMHHLPGLAWIKDVQGRYVYANEAAVAAFGLDRDRAAELLHGRTDAEIFPGPTAAQFQLNDARAVANPAGVQAIETLGAGPSARHSIVHKFPILGPDGAPAWVGGIAIDITDRLRAEQALREEARRKDEFIAMLAHELRNPLAPIANALQVMAHPAATREIADQVRQIADRQLSHMTRLLDDLLDTGRISQGRIELRKEIVDLGVLVRRTVAATHGLFHDHHHTLDVRINDPDIRVYGDPTRLEQIVTNLLTNAAKYTDPGGAVVVTLDRRQDDVVLSVRDTGIGIAAEMLHRIFDPFVQAERRLDRARGGVGIGLTLVRRLAELHDGTVSAHSDGPGCGSEFVVVLPAVVVEVSRASVPRPPATAVSPRVHRVLVVDDNLDAANGLAALLRLQGQDVQVAFDGPAALAAADGFNPTLVFLDLGMPGMDGCAVARHLRASPRHRAATLVALTGWGRDEDRALTRECGFNDHVTKPIDLDVLRALLAR